MEDIRLLRGRTFDGQNMIENAEIGINIKSGIIEYVDEINGKNNLDITILPGLIDTHIHFFGSESDQLIDWVLTDNVLLTIKSVYDAEALLDAGFTTVRTMGDKVSLGMSKAEKLRILKGPRIISSGYSIAETGGNDDPKFLSHELSKEFSYSYYCDSPWECRKAVRMNIRNGAESIKAYSSRSFVGGGKLKTELTVDELSAISDEAHVAHLKAAAHSYGPDAIQNSLDANFDSIEHGLGITEDQAEFMKKKDIFYVPTLSVYRAKVSSNQERNELVKKHFEKDISIAFNAGVKIATGTDFLGTRNEPHGLNASEIIYLSEFTGNIYALKAATSLAAECLGLNNIGFVKKGFQADIISVKGDPLKEITKVRRGNVIFVMKKGEIIKDIENLIK
ncbi:MAG: amidohydrolase family protein [Thermoplasmata archaeon]|nr:amidohydrolase family protein [Thermoplasmata archaeon]